MAQLPDYKTDMNDPLVLNSLTDLVFNKEAYDRRYGTNSDLLRRVSSLPKTIFDSILWEQTAKPVVGNVVNAVQQAQAEQRNPIGAAVRGLGTGLQAAGWNALVNVVETLDIAANPVKAALIETTYKNSGGQRDYGAKYGGDVAKGVRASLGLERRQGRVNYDWETGNMFTNFGLELVSDPMNLLSLGGSTLVKKGASAGLSAAAKATGSTLTEEAMQAAAKRMSASALRNGKIDYSVLEGLFKGAEVPANFLDELTAYLPRSYTIGQKLYNLSEGIQSGLFRSAIATSGVTLPYRTLRAGYRGVRDLNELFALRRGVLQPETIDTIAQRTQDVLDSKRYKIVRKEYTRKPIVGVTSPVQESTVMSQELKRLRAAYVYSPNAEFPTLAAPEFIQLADDVQVPEIRRLFDAPDKGLQELAEQLADKRISAADKAILEQQQAVLQVYKNAQDIFQANTDRDLLEFVQDARERVLDVSRQLQRLVTERAAMGLSTDMVQLTRELTADIRTEYLTGLNILSGLYRTAGLDEVFSFREFQELVSRLHAAKGAALDSVEAYAKTVAELPDAAYFLQLKEIFQAQYSSSLMSFEEFFSLIQTIGGSPVTFLDELTNVLLRNLAESYRQINGKTLVDQIDNYLDDLEKFFTRSLTAAKDQPGFKSVATLERFKNVTERLTNYASTAQISDVTGRAYPYRVGELVYSLNSVPMTEANYKQLLAEFIEEAKQMQLWPEDFPSVAEINSLEDAQRLLSTVDELRTNTWLAAIDETKNNPLRLPDLYARDLQHIEDFVNFRLTQQFKPSTFAPAEGLNVYTVKRTQLTKMLGAMSDDGVIALARTFEEITEADKQVLRNLPSGDEVLRTFDAFREARQFLETIDSLAFGNEAVISLEQARALVDILSSKENVSLAAYYKDPQKFLDILFDKASVNASMSGYNKLETLEAWATRLDVTTEAVIDKYTPILGEAVAGKDHDALIDVLKTIESIKADPTVAPKVPLTADTWVYDIETTGLSKKSGRISQISAVNPVTGKHINYYVRTTEIPSARRLRQLGLTEAEFVEKYKQLAEVPSDSVLRKAGLTAAQYREIHNGPGSVSLEEALGGLLNIIRQNPAAKFTGFNNDLFDHPFISEMLSRQAFPLDLVDAFTTAQQGDTFRVIKELADYPFFTDKAQKAVKNIIDAQAARMDSLEAVNLFQTIDLSLVGYLRQLSATLYTPIDGVAPITKLSKEFPAAQLDEAAQGIQSVFSKKSRSSNMTGAQLEDSLAFFALKEQGSADRWVQDTLRLREAEWIAKHPDGTAESLTTYLAGEERALFRSIIPEDSNIIAYMGDILQNTHVFSANKVVDYTHITDVFGKEFVDARPYQWEELTRIAKRVQGTADNTAVADLLYSVRGRDALPGLHQFMRELQGLFIDDVRKYIPVNENSLLTYATARNIYHRLTSSETLGLVRSTDDAAKAIAQRYADNPLVQNIVDPVKDLLRSGFELPDDSALARYRTSEFFGEVDKYVKTYNQDALNAVSKALDNIDASATGAQHLRSRLRQASTRVENFERTLSDAMHGMPEATRNTVLTRYSTDLLKHQYRRMTKALLEDFPLFQQYLYHQAGGTMLIVSDDLKLPARVLTQLREQGIHYSSAVDKHIFVLDRDMLHMYVDMPVPENLTVLSNLKDLQLDGVNRVAKALNDTRASLEDVGDTLGDLFNPSLLEQLQQYIPTNLLERAIKWEDLRKLGWAETRKYNNSIIAQTGNARMSVKAFAPTSILKNTVERMVDDVVQVEAKAKFLSMFFNSEMVVNSSPIFQHLSTEEIRKLLVQHSEYRLVWVDAMQKVHQVSPHNAKLFNEAVEKGAVIVTAQSYGKMFKVLNQPQIDNVLVKALQRITVLYKVGYLGSLGFLIRNLLDGITKNKLTLQDSTSIPKVISHMFDTSKLYMKYSDMVKDMTEYAGASSRKWNKSLFDDYFAEHTDTLLDRDMFQLIHEFIQDGPSGGLTKELEEFLSKSSDAAGDSDLFYTALSKIPYFSQITTANSNLESIMRLSLFLRFKELGGTTSEAIQKVIKTHFSYSDKTVGQLYAEVVFPFIGFSLKNMEFYLDAVKEYGGFATYTRALMNSAMDLDRFHAPEWIDYEEQDRTSHDIFSTPNTGVDISASLLYHVLAGNLIFDDAQDAEDDSRKELFRVLKLNPSVMDAFNFGMAPLSSMGERLLPMFSYPLEAYMNGTLGSVTLADYIENTLPIYSSLTYRGVQAQRNEALWGAPIFPSMLGIATGYKRFDPDNPPATLTAEQKYTWFAIYKTNGLPEKFNPCNYELYPQYIPEPIDPNNPYTLDLNDPDVEKLNRWQVADWFAAYKYKDLPAEYNPYRYYPQFSKFYMEQPLNPAGLPNISEVTEEQMQTWYGVYKLHNLPAEYNPYKYYPQFSKSVSGIPRSVRNGSNFRQMSRVYNTHLYMQPSVGYLRQHNRVRNMAHNRHKTSIGTASYRATQRLGYGLTPMLYRKTSHRVSPFIG